MESGQNGKWSKCEWSKWKVVTSGHNGKCSKLRVVWMKNGKNSKCSKLKVVKIESGWNGSNWKSDGNWSKWWLIKMKSDQN